VVVLVEERDRTRAMFTAALHAAGFAVRPTLSFDEALRVIESLGSVDLVVMDIGLEGHGLRFAEHVRLHGLSPRLIAVTNRSRTGDPREMLFAAYFLKPVFPETLVEAVRFALLSDTEA
jgi:DNA-binding response OmpR family regulator